MANTVGFHFLHHKYSTLPLLLLPGNTGNTSYLCYLHSQFQIQHFHHKQFRLQQRNLFSSTHLSPALSILCRSRLWDPNAESYEEEDDDNFDAATQALEEYIDSIWILKVFGSYGWMFPVILISLLLASGLKAFLLAMALPLLQSTFTFAFQRMQKTKPKHKSKKSYKSTKKGTPRASSSRTVKQEEAIWDDNPRAQKKTRGYGSWVSSKESRVNLGGWDELDTGLMDANVRPSKRQEQKPSGLRDGPAKKIKVSRKWAGTDTPPLLLRLLISIFPFFEFME